MIVLVLMMAIFVFCQRKHQQRLPLWTRDSAKNTAHERISFKVHFCGISEKHNLLAWRQSWCGPLWVLLTYIGVYMYTYTYVFPKQCTFRVKGCSHVLSKRVLD